MKTRTMRGVALSVNSRPFVAKYDGECSACGDEFEAGTPVRYRDGKLVEVECRPDPEELTPEQVAEVRAARCERCFCVHAGEC